MPSIRMRPRVRMAEDFPIDNGTEGAIRDLATRRQGWIGAQWLVGNAAQAP